MAPHHLAASGIRTVLRRTIAVTDRQPLENPAGTLPRGRVPLYPLGPHCRWRSSAALDWRPLRRAPVQRLRPPASPTISRSPPPAESSADTVVESDQEDASCFPTATPVPRNLSSLSWTLTKSSSSSANSYHRSCASGSAAAHAPAGRLRTGRITVRLACDLDLGPMILPNAPGWPRHRPH